MMQKKKTPVSDKPMVKKNLLGRTVKTKETKVTNRDSEGMPYGRETVIKTRAVFDKEGNFVKGKKVSYQEKSTGSRILGSRKVDKLKMQKRMMEGPVKPIGKTVKKIKMESKPR